MKKLYLILFVAFFCCGVAAQPVLTFSPVIAGLTAAVDVVNAKDGTNRIFIVQQNGMVRILSGGSLLPAPFMNISSIVTFSGEQGLLSMAFHPQYASNGYFFVFYNNTAGNTELAQFHVSATDPNAADPASRKILLTIAKPFTNHNGCKLQFGPDGYLYFGPGDGGSGGDPFNNAQNLNSLLGKMLRINVDNFTTAPYYSIPPTNPLVGMANTRPEIYQWGLRNPWRWSFDRSTGDMWIADVGQGAWEEVNRIPAAATSARNFGWRCYEGTHDYDLSQCGSTPASGKTSPIFEYGHNAAGGFSITGGYVYRGAEYPSFQGWYVCADYVYSNGWLIKPNGTGGYTVATQNNFPANITTFGEAENGTLYLATPSILYKIISSGVVAVQLVSFDAVNYNGSDNISWQISSTQPASFEIERSTDGTRFNSVSTITADASFEYSKNIPSASGDRYYRLKIINNDGSIQYSAVKKISGYRTGIFVTSNPAGSIDIVNTTGIKSIQIVNTSGQTIKIVTDLPAGSHTISLNAHQKGIYFLRCADANGEIQTFKILN